jgi:hypothetical protein
MRPKQAKLRSLFADYNTKLNLCRMEIVTMFKIEYDPSLENKVF